jgi:hypothetical protein
MVHKACIREGRRYYSFMISFLGAILIGGTLGGKRQRRKEIESAGTEGRAKQNGIPSSAMFDACMNSSILYNVGNIQEFSTPISLCIPYYS